MFFAFNLPSAAKRYAEIAVALGAAPAASDEETGLRGIETLESLAVSAEIPMRLRDWSIPHSAIEGNGDCSDGGPAFASE